MGGAFDAVRVSALDPTVVVLSTHLWCRSPDRGRIHSDLLALYPAVVALYGVRVSQWPAWLVSDLVEALPFREGTSTRGYAQYVRATSAPPKPGDKEHGLTSEGLALRVRAGKLDPKAAVKTEATIEAWNASRPITAK